MCADLSKFALQVEVQSPQTELLYPNPIVTPSWDRNSREGVIYALQTEGVRLDSAALIARMKQYYSDEVTRTATGTGKDAAVETRQVLLNKLQLMEADTRRLLNIHLWDEVNCRLQLGVQQWGSERKEPLPDAEFVKTLERSALVCQLHEQLGPKIETEAELQAAIKLSGGYAVGLTKRLLSRAADALQSGVITPQPMDVDANSSVQSMDTNNANSSGEQWWGVKNSESDSIPRLSLIGAHDTTLLPLLIAFGLFDMRWPPFGSSICIELYRCEGDASADQFFVRLIYCWPRRSGTDADSPIQIDRIAERCYKLTDFLRRIESYSPADD